MEKKTVLIVEDEAPIADILLYALQTEGYHAAWTSTYHEALEYVQSTPPDLVILDINLPDGSGFDLCREIRTQSSLPILFLSSRTGEIDRVAGLEMGADDYIVKPFSPRELTARVRAVLRRTYPRAEEEEGSQTPSEIPFTIDAPRKRILYFGTPLLLSRYEYRILKLLISKPGWVFTREQILSMVWEDPEESFDRTIDTHVKNIRARARADRKSVV